MKTICFLILALALVTAPTLAQNQPYKSSPFNPNNSRYNPDNSSLMFENSPLNPKNAPLVWDSPRRLYDDEGEPLGYVVPKKGGGFNIFDFEGHRQGYIPED